MAEEYTLQYTGAQIDERLTKAGNAVLFTSQSMTEAQKAQAKENLGVTDTNFYVTATVASGTEDDYECTADKTMAEITAAYNYGKSVYLRFSPVNANYIHIPLITCQSGAIGFSLYAGGESAGSLGGGMWEALIEDDESFYVTRKEVGGSADAVLYTEQTLTPEQQAQARENIGAASQVDMDIIKARTTPDYVITEATAVIDKITAAQGNRTFVLAAITDLHYGNGSYSDGVKHAAQALKYIDERIKLDAVAVLGDFTDGFIGRDGQYANGINDFRAVNEILNDLRFGPNLRIHGNHDFYEGHMPEVLRYTNAYSDDVTWGSNSGDYFYKDFNNHKLRIVCLNTVANDGGSVGYTDAQAQWFADMLDLSNKDDAMSWHILILSHQPVDYGHASGYTYHLANIIDAYIKGATYTSGNVSCDYTGKNAATLVGNIHGHIHNLLVDRIYVGSVSGGVQTDVLRIATPEACYGRANGYSGVWHEETTYGKTKNSAEDTSFVVYCIDLDSNTIKAICYGAGYDRKITYSDTLSWEEDGDDNGAGDGGGDNEDGGGSDSPAYTNWIPLAVDTSGNTVTDGVMYTNSRWNSSGDLVEATGNFITGLIPVKIGDYIQVRWDTESSGLVHGYCSFRAFDVNREPLFKRLQFWPELETGGSTTSNAIRNSVGYQLSEGALDFTLPATEHTPDTTVYLAFVLTGDPSKAIVTINEPIE